MLLRVLAVLTVIALTAGCSSSDPGFVVATPTGSGPHAGPGKLGPVHEVPAGSCPLARADFVRNTMGMRLGRLTRLHGAGVSGCRFYALQNSPLHTSEHLPGAKQPVLEILVRRLPTAVEAHDAVVLLARTGANVHRVHLGHTTGACFQTHFYPKDRGKDWACAASVRRTVVVVHSVDTTGTFGTATVTRAVLRRV